MHGFRVVAWPLMAVRLHDVQLGNSAFVLVDTPTPRRIVVLLVLRYICIAVEPETFKFATLGLRPKHV